MAGEVSRLQGKLRGSELPMVYGDIDLHQAGKKKVKTITRVMQKANRSPYPTALRRANSDHPRGLLPTPRSQSDTRTRNGTTEVSQTARTPGGRARQVPRLAVNDKHEQQPLRTPESRFSSAVGSYGSILPTSPHDPDEGSLRLPEPAVNPRENGIGGHAHQDRPKTPSPILSRRDAGVKTPTNLAPSSTPNRNDSVDSTGSKGETGSSSSAKKSSQFLRRVFSHSDRDSREKSAQGEWGSETDQRQDEFFAFLDHELGKIESFYQLKEHEATERLKILRQQLHIMRDRRNEDLLMSRRAQKQNINEPQNSNGLNGFRFKDALTGRNLFRKPSEPHLGLETPGILAEGSQSVANNRDFSRRPESRNADVSYRTAKRKLKYALQELYRGLELLKSYAYLNRTAFRKINKKYDKAVDARPTLRYMTEKVNKAWFVQSDVAEILMTEAEDLYARYFERGQRKIAISKLRRSGKKSGDYSANSFRSGLLIMAGALFGIQSLVYAGQHFKNPNTTIQTQTSYLLQVSMFG